MNERRPMQDVNLELGNEVSKMLYEASKLTHENRPEMLVELSESFSGLRGIPLGDLPDFENLYLNMGVDGVGTKVEISERLEDHSVVAHDLFAMVCDDAVVRGAEPIAVASILDVRQLNDSKETKNAIRQLCNGYVNAAKAAGVVVVNGELAELGDRIGGYGEFNYNWGATALWLAHKDRLLTGTEINVGDGLVGLAEKGMRSNGITGFRNAMKEEYGKNWHDRVVEPLGNLPLGRLAQEPSTIYSKFISELTGGYDINKRPKAKITGAAHITGGGQPEKIKRMLEPSGLGATVFDPIEPPQIMLQAQEILDISDEEAYTKWHMGSGMIVATPEPHKILTEAMKQGVEAKQIGQITRDPKVIIRNKAVKQTEEWLEFS